MSLHYLIKLGPSHLTSAAANSLKPLKPLKLKDILYALLSLYCVLFHLALQG